MAGRRCVLRHLRFHRALRHAARRLYAVGLADVHGQAPHSTGAALSGVDRYRDAARHRLGDGAGLSASRSIGPGTGRRSPGLSQHISRSAVAQPGVLVAGHRVSVLCPHRIGDAGAGRGAARRTADSDCRDDPAADGAAAGGPRHDRSGPAVLRCRPAHLLLGVGLVRPAPYWVALAGLGAALVAARGWAEALAAVAPAAAIAALRIPRIGPVAWLGAISYSLYLLHVPVGGRIINLASRISASPLFELAVVAWHLRLLLRQPR